MAVKKKPAPPRKRPEKVRRTRESRRRPSRARASDGTARRPEAAGLAAEADVIVDRPSVGQANEADDLFHQNLRLRRDLHFATERAKQAEGERADPWSDRSKGMRCATCVFFVPKIAHGKLAGGASMDTASRLGRCRRSNPTMKGYPAVFVTDWCGEHKLDENKV